VIKGGWEASTLREKNLGDVLWPSRKEREGGVLNRACCRNQASERRRKVSRSSEKKNLRERLVKENTTEISKSEGEDTETKIHRHI